MVFDMVSGRCERAVFAPRRVFAGGVVIPDGDAPAPPLAIDVDPNKVTGFAHTVQANVQGTITPTAPSLASTLGAGVTFGEGNPSVALKAMLDKYGECLATMHEQLKSVGQYVEVLVAAANQISANYVSSDRLAQASNEDIDDILNNAIATMRSTQIKPLPMGGDRNGPRYA